MIARALRALVAGLGDHRELQERHALRLRPSEEHLLHWAYDGVDWHLHGTHAPPAFGRLRAVTRRGWCLAAVEPTPECVTAERP